MTQEEKSLLLQDLCARLPYGVKIYTKDGKNDASFILKISDLNWIFEDNRIDEMYEYDGWKPYLRPMSSMTEEEVEEFESVCKFKCYPKHLRGAFFDNDCTPFSTGDVDYEYRYIRTEDVINCIDWLNSNHFDYRGLIEKGLALKAPKGMYETGKIDIIDFNRFLNIT